MGKVRSRRLRARLRMAAGLLLWLLAAAWAGTGPLAEAQVPVSSISDTVYYANGVAAGGQLLISWSSFHTASGQSVLRAVRPLRWHRAAS